MFYKNLRFPAIEGRPFFYTNFVSTIDGVVGVRRDGYWPIGSKKDYQILLELRAYADVLIHGAKLAEQFGEITSQNLQKAEFQKMRTKLKKDSKLKYIVISKNVEQFSQKGIEVFSGTLEELVTHLNQIGAQRVLVEGGPTLLTTFLKTNLIDEIFLTIAPSVYGHQKDTTISMVENTLFEPQKIKTYKLLSNKSLGNEVFLRYRKKS